jgi:glyoxylase-like metal-dependent hydrolase (beta-lactamase superfamily II)
MTRRNRMSGDIHERISTVNVWWEQIKFNIPIHLVKGGVNALIDAGPPQQSAAVITAALEPFGVSPTDIDLVLLTHGHLDHVGGLPHLKNGERPKICIHREDAFLIEDHSRAFDEFYGVGAKVLSGKDDLSEEKKGFLYGAGPEFKADRLLSDGDTIDLGEGIELRVVSLPGHTKGSVGYYWEKEGIIIAGDSIPALGGPDGSLPIITDLDGYVKSVDRLLQMNLRTLVFTHGYRGVHLPPSTTRRGPEIAEYLRDAKEVAVRLKESLQRESTAGGNGPFPERIDRVIAGMPAEMKFVPLAKQLSRDFSALTVYNGLKGK